MNPTIENNFKYHSPIGVTEKHGALRAKAKELADLIDQTLPPAAGREKATAITKVEEAMFWACSGVTRNSGADMARMEAPNRRCTLPPEGWSCTRERGHQGPCAATPMP